MKKFEEQWEKEIAKIINEQKKFFKEESQKIRADMKAEVRNKIRERELKDQEKLKEQKTTSFFKTSFFKILIVILVSFVSVAVLIYGYIYINSSNENVPEANNLKSNTSIEALNTQLDSLIGAKKCFTDLREAQDFSKISEFPCGSFIEVTDSINRIHVIDSMIIVLESHMKNIESLILKDSSNNAKKS